MRTGEDVSQRAKDKASKPADPGSTEAISTEAIADDAEILPARRGNGRTEQKGSSEQRTAALKQAVSKLRIRRFSLPMERWLMVIGGGLMVAGLGAIVLGWYGAAHTPYGFEQLPYLISGGLLGLALAVLGGLLYFAYWLTRQIQESRQQSDATTAALAGIAELLAGGSNGSRPTGGNGAATRAQFVASATGTMLHRPDCAVVTGKSGLRTVSADDPGLQPCKLCDPLGTA
jgi:hypothetical protein